MSPADRNKTNSSKDGLVYADIALPPKLVSVLDFSQSVRFRGAYGGRGSGKTRSFALAAAIRGLMLSSEKRNGVILCAREFMNSLDDSSLAEVKSAVNSIPWLRNKYDMGEKYIRTSDGRIRFVFSGLRNSLNSIKSKAKILIAWVDEAEPVSEAAWQKLLPTVREPGSEIWVTWNPETDGSATDKRFIKNTPDSCLIAEVNYSDNPFFPDTLNTQRLDDFHTLNPQTYAWIWEGKYRENSDAQILHDKYKCTPFEPEKPWNGPYYGLDYGFANDPTACVEVWIYDRKLFVRREAGGIHMELDDTAKQLIDAMPDIRRYKVRADSARPESSSYLKRHGLPLIESVKKWSGSVEDGIEFLRSFDQIVIHPDCKETLYEARLYSFKRDRLTGDIKPQPVDKFNHYMDAIRYAIQPLIKNTGYTLKNL